VGEGGQSDESHDQCDEGHDQRYHCGKNQVRHAWILGALVECKYVYININVFFMQIPKTQIPGYPELRPTMVVFTGSDSWLCAA